MMTRHCRRSARRRNAAALSIAVLAAAPSPAAAARPTRTSSERRQLVGSSGGGSTQLNLVAYSTPKKAYDALTAAFAQTSAGKGVAFGQSFGASGSQSRAVDSGQPADVVAFSTTPDMTRLVKDGIVAERAGTPTRRRGSPATRSSCSSCARATPSTSPAGMT